MDDHWREALRRIRTLAADLRAATTEIERLERQLETARRRARKYAERVDELEGELARVPDQVAVARRDALKLQALRARLAKTNMSPEARLRTLELAREAGIALTAEQVAELQDRRSDRHRRPRRPTPTADRLAP